MTLSLQSTCVYGPVKSRRLGNSLGINILPVTAKFCLSDCIYCQYGHTDSLAMRNVKLPRAKDLIPEIEAGIVEAARNGQSIDAITFSGNGESTLHPELGEIVRAVKCLRDQYFPSAKVGILSDSSRVGFANVRKVLEEFDERYMKLDAGSRDAYININHPLVPMFWDLMLDGLIKLAHKGITIQSMFISEPFDNSRGELFDLWLERISSIRPSAVHVYTVDRDPANPKVKPVSRQTLERVAIEVHKRIYARVECFESNAQRVQSVHMMEIERETVWES